MSMMSRVLDRITQYLLCRSRQCCVTESCGWVPWNLPAVMGNAQTHKGRSVLSTVSGPPNSSLTTKSTYGRDDRRAAPNRALVPPPRHARLCTPHLRCCPLRRRTLAPPSHRRRSPRKPHQRSGCVPTRRLTITITIDIRHHWSRLPITPDMTLILLHSRNLIHNVSIFNRQHTPHACSLRWSRGPHVRPPHAQRRPKPSQRPRSIYRCRCCLQGPRRHRSCSRRRWCRSQTRKTNGDRDRAHVWTKGSVGGLGCQRGRCRCGRACAAKCASTVVIITWP